jgi:FkbM family methyltransferase
MRRLERWASRIRHSRLLENASWLNDWIRPHYIRMLAFLNPRGLVRNINGSDVIRVPADMYGTPDEYEPEVWRRIMSEVRPNDVIADVGAYVGLYTVALAQRVGPLGQVYAFEPDAESFCILRRHVECNGVGDWVHMLPYAVGAHSGTVTFTNSRGSESHVGTEETRSTQEIPLVSLDSVFCDAHIDLLKIDVEGFEEHVLRGATRLLGDPKRAPRAIFIEAHPFAWMRFDTSGEAILNLLRAHGYAVFDLRMRPIDAINKYGEVCAFK